ncbi:MAG: AraC family transcriptional regulator [Caldimonas sp.]
MHIHLFEGPEGRGERGREAAPALVLRTALRGAVHVAWRNRSVRVDPDTYLVLGGGRPCSAVCEASAACQVLVVEVSASELDSALAGHAADLEALDAHARGARAGARHAFSEHLRTAAGGVGGRLRALGAACKGGGPATLAERDQLPALLGDVIGEELDLRRRAARITSVKPATRDELLRRILLAADFIQSNHDEPLSLDDMARAASLSRFHFVRLFSLVHGETPHAFLLRKRTAVARRHLEVGSAYAEAATRAGFGSRSALFRNLRKSAVLGAAAAMTSTPEPAAPCFLFA